MIVSLRMRRIVKGEARDVAMLVEVDCGCAVENVTASEESAVVLMIVLHGRSRVCRGVGDCDVCVSGGPRLRRWSTAPYALGVYHGLCGYLFF